MIVPTKVYIIFGHDVIYETSYECKLFEDECKDDIYEESVDGDKRSIKIHKARYFDKGNFLIKIEQFKYELIFKYSFNEHVELPEGLTHLIFGTYFNQPVKLPEGLTHLIFGGGFNQLVELPEGLTHLTFGWFFDKPIDLSLIHI